MRRSITLAAYLLALVSFLAVFQGCSTKKLLSINVRCYPDTAVVYVVQQPDNKTKTPGTIKLARDAGPNLNIVAPLPKQTYELRFKVPGKELEPVYVRWLYADLGLWDWYKTYIGSGFKISSVDRWSPDDIYVIDTERAIELGKCEPVLLALQSKVVWARAEAAEALAALNCTEAVPQLIESLNDINPEVRIAGIRALSLLADTRAIEPIHLTINDEDPRVWVESAKALAGFGDARYKQHLANGESCENTRERRLFLQHLSHFDHEQSENILIDALGDPELSIVETAIYSLTEIGSPRAIEPLMSDVIAKHSDFNLLARTAECLRHIGDKQAISLLSETFARENNDHGMRCALVLALVGGMAESAVPGLVEAMDGENVIRLSKSDYFKVSIPDLQPPSPDNVALEGVDRATDWHFSSEGFSTMVDEEFRYGYSPPQTVFASAIAIDYVTKMILGDPERDRQDERKERFIQSVYKKAEREAVYDLARDLGFIGKSSLTEAGGSADGNVKPSIDFIVEHPDLPPDELMHEYNMYLMRDYLHVDNMQTAVVNGLVEVKMDITMDPVYFALTRITGQNLGKDPGAWKE